MNLAKEHIQVFRAAVSHTQPPLPISLTLLQAQLLPVPLACAAKHQAHSKHFSGWPEFPS